MKTDSDELREAGFIQGKIGELSGLRCDICDSPIGGNRAWWRKESIEYDEWGSICKPCALKEVHQYD